MLAGVVEVVAVIGSVALLLAVHVAVHAAAADGALEQPGQDVLVVKAVCLELALVGLLALLLRKLPVLLGDDGLVDAVVERIVLLLDDVVLVAGAGNLFIVPAPVGQLTAVHGIIEHADEEGACEGLPFVVVAADLAGAEGLYATDTFADVFRDAVQRGVPFTIHAGEAAGAESVECALNFQAVRIGHGVRSTENPLIMQELADRETALELCPTSNLNTKIYETIENYPIQQLMNKGIKVTVNTDNMMVSNTTEARELALVADTFNMEKKDVKKLIMNGVEAAFTTEGIKNRLRARVETQFAKVAGIRG